jgi:hypothetical protein
MHQYQRPSVPRRYAQFGRAKKIEAAIASGFQTRAAEMSLGRLLDDLVDR